ncbi:hypothetical protein [Antarcticimicrobium sediminis]|uniref:Transcription elongation factor, GreA/GreB, C-term n=1 Tax=Antarcticimicrobium sediminis TaxID=2546227 RepID=A0A4R5EFP1_9RHOB|nr:hypothetical protein [Antarcticimicrobium sediminis]TDE33064.1 hypothetical protein E1B25_21640 [Antarcticimicrobium sediminis]
MSSIHHTRLPSSANTLGPKARSHKWSILPEADYRQLQHHLNQCESTGRPASLLLSHVLLHKLMTLEPVDNVYAGDLVTGGCQVAYSVDQKPASSGLLVHRARSGGASGVIPVSSLLGATLIGMRTGQRAPLLHEDGTIGTLSVLSVTHPG